MLVSNNDSSLASFSEMSARMYLSHKPRKSFNGSDDVDEVNSNFRYSEFADFQRSKNLDNFGERTFGENILTRFSFSNMI